jgi:hypothetical protein
VLPLTEVTHDEPWWSTRFLDLNRIDQRIFSIHETILAGVHTRNPDYKVSNVIILVRTRV